MTEEYYDSDDSIKDPDFVCEQNHPRCSKDRDNYVLEQNDSSDISETSSSTPELARDDELIGVNKLLFSEKYFKIVEKVMQKHIIICYLMLYKLIKM